jgi:hypothetical protein
MKKTVELGLLCPDLHGRAEENRGKQNSLSPGCDLKPGLHEYEMYEETS